MATWRSKKNTLTDLKPAGKMVGYVLSAPEEFKHVNTLVAPNSTEAICSVLQLLKLPCDPDLWKLMLWCCILIKEINLYSADMIFYDCQIIKCIHFGSGVPHLKYNKISKKNTFTKLYFLKILNRKTLHINYIWIFFFTLAWKSHTQEVSHVFIQMETCLTPLLSI